MMEEEQRYNLYAFCDDTLSRTMYNCIFAAAKNWKAARNMIIRKPENKHKKLTHIVGRRIGINCCKGEGFLSSEEVLEKHSWFECRCGEKLFVALDDGHTCRCKTCGREKRVIHPLLTD